MSDTPTQASEPSLGKLFAALAKAQGAFQAIAKNRTVKIPTKNGGNYTFRFADLEAIIAATRPALTDNGLSVVQVVRTGALVTILGHESGAALESSVTLPDMHPAADPKEYGAKITYLRRYAYQSMVCVIADDDLDEDGEGVGNQQQTQPQTQPQQRQSYSAEQFDANYPTWKKLIESGKKTAADIIAMVESKAPLTPDQKKKINAVKAPQQEGAAE